jgi:ATP-dependent Lhr-like helicase
LGPSRYWQYAALLARLSAEHRVPNEFWAHHGNLAKELRESAEAELKDAARPATAVCTSTLELGIDIGAMASIAQIGPPPSVAALRQRLGRSGRRGEPATLRVYISEPEIDVNTPPQATLRPRLVQTIATIRLLLTGWYEPPRPGALHLSTLVQQTLALIAQKGGVTAADAYRTLCETGPFTAVTAEMFAQLLRGLHAHDLVEQFADGDLILGRHGEHLVGHYSFFAAFNTPQEYRVTSHGHTLGTLPLTHPISTGMLLIFGGQPRRVLDIDDAHKAIDVTDAPGGTVPSFPGDTPNVDDRVRREMRAVYLDPEVPDYLDPTAADLLQEGLTNFQRLGLDKHILIESGTSSILLHVVVRSGPWGLAQRPPSGASLRAGLSTAQEPALVRSGKARRNGADQRASPRGSRPGCARSLGRRPDRRKAQQLDLHSG